MLFTISKVLVRNVAQGSLSSVTFFRSVAVLKKKLGLVPHVDFDSDCLISTDY